VAVDDGEAIATLLQNNSSLNVLSCFCLSLGVQGALALQPGIRANQNLKTLELNDCHLGDKGVAFIVDANYLQDTETHTFE
jgi:Ran GTPase-activating protein (RanGAP) involved in mRNA processing and transport